MLSFTMRLLLFCLLLAGAGISAGFKKGSGEILGWQTNFSQPGPGGLLTSLDIQCDQGFQNCNPSTGTVTKVNRMDGYGGWVYDSSLADCGNQTGVPGCWRQLVTAASMPNGSAGIAGTSPGIYEVVIAPSNTSHFYMIWGGDGCTYGSTNKGLSWTKLASPGGSCLPPTTTPGGYNSNTGQLDTKTIHPYIAVDPANENQVYATTPGAGAYLSTNGGSTWTVVSTLGNGSLVQSYDGGTIFAFDRSGGTTGGLTNNIYACTYGTGVFKSTNAGSTWSALNTTGMPTTCQSIAVDPTGVLWLLDRSGTHNANIYTGGAWTNLSTVTTNQNFWFGVAIDTNNCATEGACHVTLVDDGGGQRFTTTGYSGSWSARTAPDMVTWPPSGIIANDVPWLIYSGNYYTATNAAYNPKVANQVEIPMGTGYLGFVPSSGSYATTSLSQGMGLLPINTILSTSSSSTNIIVTAFDRSVFQITSPLVYASTYNQQTFGPGWSADYAKTNSNFIVNMSGAKSGSSTNSGATWTLFGSMPIENGGQLGGHISASTTTNFLMYFGQRGDLFQTANGGSTWTQVLVYSGQAAGAGLTTTGVAGSTYNFSSVPASIQTQWGSSYAFNLVNVTRCSGNSMSVSNVTSTTVVVSSQQCASTQNGDSIYLQALGPGAVFDGPGFSFFSTSNAHRICADPAGNGTFYAYVSGTTPGFYISTNGGTSWSLMTGGSGNFGGVTNSGPSVRVECPPGVSNEFYFTGGSASGGNSLYDCTNSSGTVSCTAMTGVTNALAIGFGQAKPGGSGYPALYTYATIGGVNDLYRSYDHGSTWTALGANTLSLDFVADVSGDLSDYKAAYICYRGSSCKYGRFN